MANDCNKWLFIALCSLGMVIKALIEEDDNLKELISEEPKNIKINE